MISSFFLLFFGAKVSDAVMITHVNIGGLQKQNLLMKEKTYQKKYYTLYTGIAV